MTTESEMTTEVPMSGTRTAPVVLRAQAPAGASPIVPSGTSDDHDPGETGTSEAFPDPAGDVFRRMRHRARTPVTESDDAPARGTPLGPQVSFGALIRDHGEAGHDYGQVVPLMKWGFYGASVLPLTLNALARCMENMTQRNARFYGTMTAGGLFVLILFLIAHFTH